MARGPKTAAVAAGAGLLIALAASIAHLFALRHAEGDVYAPGSTLRTDPLGAKGLLVSLSGLEGVEAVRNFRPLAQLEEGPDATLVILEADPSGGMATSEMEGIERFARRGGRVLIAFEARERVTPNRPAPPPWARSRTTPGEAPSETPRPRRSPSFSPTPPPLSAPSASPTPGTESNVDGAVGAASGETPNESSNAAPEAKATPTRTHRPTMTPAPLMMGMMPEVDLWKERLEKWRVGLTEVVSTTPTLAAADAPAGLAPKLEPKTVVEFRIDKPEAWRPIYLRGANAQVAEGRLSQGSVALFADAFPFSNESLAKAPDPALIAWAVGSGRRVIFDETHLGTERADGMMSLARKYGLQWTLVPLGLLAALFIWRSGSPLAPRDPEADLEVRRGEAETRDAFEGGVNLLRRNIAARDLLGLCLEEWKKSGAPKPPDMKVRLARAESLAAVRDRAGKGAAIAAAYNELVRILSLRS